MGCSPSAFFQGARSVGNMTTSAQGTGAHEVASRHRWRFYELDPFRTSAASSPASIVRSYTPVHPNPCKPPGSNLAAPDAILIAPGSPITAANRVRDLRRIVCGVAYLRRGDYRRIAHITASSGVRPNENRIVATGSSTSFLNEPINR